MKKILITVIFLMISGSLAQAQWAIMRSDADSLVQIGIDKIYNVEFDEAEDIFKEVIDRYPDHPVGYFLDAMVDWWKITLYRFTDRFDDSFLKKINKVIEVSDRHLEDNPYDVVMLFFKGGALGFRGRYHAQRENWIKAASDGKDAFNIMIKCQKIAPTNKDIMLGTGIYNYFAVAIPEKYPMVKPFTVFLPRGDKEIGLLQLKAAAKHARYAAVEAKVVLLQIYYSFENDLTKALQAAQTLHGKYSDNPYFHRYLGRAYVRRGMYDQMEATWREVLKRCIARKTGYDNLTAREAMYYIGTSLMRSGDYEMALKYFYKADEGSRKLDKDGPSGFMIETNLKIGQIFDLQGKRKYAKGQYEKVLRMDEYGNSHDEARKYLQTPYK
ncbi:MAG: tetratricopeptide repeat protein [Candidatus Kapaibacterium sp.]